MAYSYDMASMSDRWGVQLLSSMLSTNVGMIASLSPDKRQSVNTFLLHSAFWMSLTFFLDISGTSTYWTLLAYPRDMLPMSILRLHLTVGGHSTSKTIFQNNQHCSSFMYFSCTIVLPVPQLGREMELCCSPPAQWMAGVPRLWRD